MPYFFSGANAARQQAAEAGKGRGLPRLAAPPVYIAPAMTLHLSLPCFAAQAYPTLFAMQSGSRLPDTQLPCPRAGIVRKDTGSTGDKGQAGGEPPRLLTSTSFELWRHTIPCASCVPVGGRRRPSPLWLAAGPVMPTGCTARGCHGRPVIAIANRTEYQDGHCH